MEGTPLYCDTCQHVSPPSCTKSYEENCSRQNRTSQNMLHFTGNLLFYSGNLVNNTLCVNICENGGKGDLSDIECGMVVVRQTLLTVSETADL